VPGRRLGGLIAIAVPFRSELGELRDPYRQRRPSDRDRTQHERRLSHCRNCESFRPSNDAGNPEEHVDELRSAARRSWMEFDRAFGRAEIFLSAGASEFLASRFPGGVAASSLADGSMN
jgi:hypothetical protein